MSASNQAGPSSGPGSAAASEAGDPPHTPNSNYDNPNDDRKLSRGTGKRNRVHFACTECYRRKQKCNRETPCQHCIARKVPERCRTFQPGEDANDVGSRLSRLEKLLEDYLPALMNRVEVAISASNNGDHRLQHSSAEHRIVKAGTADPAMLTASPTAIHPDLGAKRLSVTTNAGAESDEDPAADQDSLSPKTGIFIGGGAMEMHLGTLLGKLPGKKPSPAFREPIRTIEGQPDLDEIMCEYGAPLGGSAEMLAALPDRALCGKLLDHYYEQINWIRQPLPRRSLLQSFDKFWDDGPKLTADNINIFVILCCLCAISCLSFEDPNMPEGAHSRILAARRYHFAARKGLHLSTVMGREDLDHIVGASLSCRFMLLDRRIGEAYTASGTLMRAAYTIGLHRDGTKLGLNLVETEARRRVWASIYFLDRLLSVTTGRPPAIDDRICDTLPPSGGVDDDVYPMPLNHPKMPEGVEPPTPMSYAIYRHHIALIEGRILAGLQSLDSTLHVSDVLALDREIRALQDGLPFYLRAKRTSSGVECDRSLDSAYGFLAVQRFLVHTEINAVRIALHRPFLLRSSSNPKYLPCREACLDAALHDIELRNLTLRPLKDNVSHELMQALRVHIGTFKWFHSLLVCGVVLLMQPDAPNAGQLRGHLQHFVNIHYGKSAHQADEMRTREAHVIELFLGKLDELQSHKAQPGGKTAGRKRSKKQLVLDEATKKPRAHSPASRTKESAAAAAATTKGDDSRDSAATRKAVGSANSREADVDEHATADLLLGLGQQARHSTQGVDAARGEGERRSASASASRSYAELSGSGSRSLQSMDASPYRQSSGDWPRGYPGVGSGGNGGGGSGTNSPLGTPGTELLGSTGSAMPSPIDVAGGGTGSGTTGGGGGNAGNSDEAQTIFDNWYRAEFATASMPSYEAPYPQNGLGALPFGLGMQMPATSAAPGRSMYNGQGPSQQMSTMGGGAMMEPGQAQQQGPPGGGLTASTGWDMGSIASINGRDAPGFPTLNQGLRGAANGGGSSFVGSSSSPPTTSMATAPTPGYPPMQPGSGVGGNLGAQSMAGANHSAGSNTNNNFGGGMVLGGMQPPTYGAGNAWPPAPDQQGNPGFDPAFWQTLIDKIAS
ncbi:uncharacterized protein PFL1_03767 [Pseudozyma flocculosa PF-1]|uniref:Related to ASG1 - activator of stress genes n=2 Tax=Pseudozyma flocculosa TaxID=84751 RepID=A0A5C3EWE9_9BASI|nr:uncharacterized protein PFL1_03767 [Pseudozyma flocculosa PF-1]EPQ28464.1 hypothetical protein PFL1_03767 [Pseudozyma flocculosa PF-1]SPO36382.1 related to ASG1 - activator of stress genes [Pseudozyma flocculosa]